MMIMMMIRVMIMMMVRVMMMIISAVTGTLIIRCCVCVRVPARIVHDCASRERTPRALIDQIIAAVTNTVELIRIALLFVIRKTRLAAVNTVVAVAPLVLGGLVEVVL